MLTPWRRWDYRGGDVCAAMFSEALMQAKPDLVVSGDLLEVGCAEFDWLSQAERCWPEMRKTGIDARGYHGDAAVRGLAQDVRTWDPRMRFHTIVSISAIEHVGLGHYGDPVDAFGDVVAMRNMRTWLHHGGWCYIDVPYGPEYAVVGTKHRIYDEAALQSRLLNGWDVQWRGYAPTSDARVMSPTYEAAAARRNRPDTLVCVCLWLQSSPELSA